MRIKTRIRHFGLALGFSLVAVPAQAVEVRLDTNSFPEAGVDTLRAASLVFENADAADATAQDLLAAARADYERLLSALYEFGYYGPVISILVNGQEAAGIPLLSGPDVINSIVIDVEPGPAFTFQDMAIAPLAPGTELPEGWRTGAQAHASVLVNSAEAAVEGWRDVGHAKAKVSDQNIVADHRNSTISADIALSPGPRLRFGDLRLPQPSAVRAERIREIAGLPTGEVFSPDDLEKSSQRLRRTGAFRSVALSEAETVGPGDTLDIIANLEDAKPRRVGFGAEISSLEGLALSGFWMHRNLLGGAERLRFEGEISGIAGDTGGEDYRLSARFDRPATFTPDTGYYIEASIQEANEPDYRQRDITIGTGLTHIFSDKLSGELGIAYQYSEIDDILGSRTLEYILLPGKLTYDDRNDPLNATDGYYLDLEATPFAGTSNQVAGARVFFDARAYRAFGAEDDTVLALRVQAGSVFGASIAEVPSEMLFFSGGAGTVRGQPYQSLGVQVPGLGQIGGRSFAALSTELRQNLWGPWSVVGFADAGFVGEGSFGQDSGEWHAGAGFGARYNTGLGPIRVDVATPLDSDAGQDFELYIGIGQAF